MVASDDMDEDEEVSGGDEPRGSLEGDENVVIDRVSENVVPDKGDGEVA